MIESRPLLRRALLFLFAGLLASPAPVAAALHGVTTADASGSVDVVVIDPTTGAAQLQFTISIGAGRQIGELGYHEPSHRLMTTTSSPLELGFIDLIAQQFSSVPITGLPAAASVAGITWDAAQDRILLSYSADGTVSERAIARLSTSGAVLNSTGDAFQDLDAIEYRSPGNRIVGCDFNSQDAARVLAITGLFDSPGSTTVGTPPFRSDVGDVAAHPQTGELFVNGFGANGGILVRLENDDTWHDIGSYNTSRQLIGIAWETAYTAGIADRGTPIPVGRLSASPNPAPGATEISFALAKAGAIRLDIVDVSGRLVRRLADGFAMAGPHQLRWDGRDDRGLTVADGVYFCRLAGRADRAVTRVSLSR